MNRCNVLLIALAGVGFCIVILAGYLDVARVRSTYAPIVALKKGRVRGIVAGKNDSLYVYIGIRYGRAERFTKPAPVEPWFGVYPATHSRAVCPQFGAPKSGNWMTGWSGDEDEDCLFLTVWRPKSERPSLRAVMLWIHGGAFEMGSAFSRNNDCQYLAQQGDVIVVSINYRLGPLGFLYADDGEFAGNWGLHDQLLALQWVQENIRAFGGNPASVTVFGESAGSMSLGALLLLPQSKGLLARAILQSGSPTATADSPEVALRKCHALARAVNCPTGANSQETVFCLKTRSISELQAATFGDLSRNEYFTPTHGVGLLPKPLNQLLKEIHLNVDILYGTVRDEGSIFIDSFVPELSKSSSLTVELIKQEIEKLMDVMRVGAYRSEVAQFYTRSLTVNSTQAELHAAISEAFGDFLFVCHQVLFVESLAQAGGAKNRFYAYRLMQKPSSKFQMQADLRRNPKWDYGIVHATDNKFLFTVPANQELDEPSHRLSHDMIRAWSNFAKSGQPGALGNRSVQWEEALPDRVNPVTRLMELKADGYRMVDGPFKETCNGFWREKLFR